MNEREKLMRRVQEVSFAITEVNLFLDTHPTDKMALDYYNRYKLLRKKLMDEYTEKYGALTADNVKATDEWTWATTPWPWEMED